MAHLLTLQVSFPSLAPLVKGELVFYNIIEFLLQMIPLRFPDFRWSVFHIWSYICMWSDFIVPLAFGVCTALSRAFADPISVLIYPAVCEEELSL